MHQAILFVTDLMEVSLTHHTFVFVNIRAVSPRITLTGSLVSSDSWTPTEPVIQVDNTLGATRSRIKKCLMSLMPQPREKGSKNGHPRLCFNKWLKSKSDWPQSNLYI